MRKGARLPERTVPVCLRGDLVAEVEDLEWQLAAQDPGPDSLEEGGADGVLSARIADLREQMRDNTYPVRLRAMPRPVWRAFVADHPPRRDDNNEIVPDDRVMEVNVETFYDDLIRDSVIDPDLSSDADWTEFVDGLTDYQFSELGAAAWALNRQEVSVPLSPAGSRTRRDTGGG